MPTQAFFTLLLLTLCCPLVVCGITKMSQKFNLQAPGVLRSCDGRSDEFYIKWSPTRPLYGDTITLDAHYMPKRNFSATYIESFVFDEDDVIIYHSNSTHSCEELYVVLWRYFGVLIKCPIIQGQPIDVKHKEWTIPASLPLFSGTYRIHTVWKDVYDHSIEILCMKGIISLLDE